MNEFFQQALLIYNLPFTVLMGGVVIFWFFSLIGTLDFDFDFDLDLDSDADLDPQVNAGHNFLSAALKVVNAQDVPLMMVLSILTLFMWVNSILSNYYLNPDGSIFMAIGLLVVNFIISVIFVKVVTQPLRPFFRAMKKDEEHVPLIGSIGTVKSRVIDEKYGQVSVPRENGSPALLNAKLNEGALVKGETIFVVSYDEKNRRYLVKSAPELQISNN